MNTTAEIYLWGTRVGIIHQHMILRIPMTLQTNG